MYIFVVGPFQFRSLENEDFCLSIFLVLVSLILDNDWCGTLLFASGIPRRALGLFLFNFEMYFVSVAILESICIEALIRGISGLCHLWAAPTIYEIL